MQITDDRIIFSDAVAVNWENVVALKALGHKILFELQGDLSIEVGGLQLSEIDEIFRAYSRRLLNP